MNRPRNGKDWVGVIALILTVTLSLILLITVIGIIVFGQELGEEGGRLLSGLGLLLGGAVATYLGYGLRHKGDE